VQVVILCGGQGTRIRDVADDIPKPMVPIGGRPILWHIMDGFARQGFKKFILCLGYKSWTIKRYFLDYHLAHSDFSVNLAAAERIEIHSSSASEDWQITFAETGLDAMTGCRVKRIEKYIRGDSFLLTYGDGLADVDVGRLIRFHRQHGKTATVTAVHPPGRFGEIELNGDQVAEFMEKPLQARGRINGGFFVCSRRIFRVLRDDPSLVFEQQPLKQLAASEQLTAYLHDGFWQPMDNSRDYRYLNDLWDSGAAPWRPGQAQPGARAA
jgi:glucose-1-phosphate cytidylyltransferase